MRDNGTLETLEDLVERYWHAARNRDWDALGTLIHEQVLYEVPQTRERLRGREAYIAFNATICGGDRTFEIDSIVADGRQAVSKVAFDIDGRTATGISFFEFRDGMIARITDYWPEACSSLALTA